MAESTATAVAREAAWLAIGDDALPALLAADGGPFDVVQAYYSRSPNTRARSVWVMRQNLTEQRLGGLRKIDRYAFRLLVRWPTASGDAEAEQAAFDAAVEQLLLRIRGPLGDHTHGGRFLSVGEEPDRISVDFDPPEHTLNAPNGGAFLSATVRYSADDQQINS